METSITCQYGEARTIILWALSLGYHCEFLEIEKDTFIVAFPRELFEQVACWIRNQKDLEHLTVNS